MKKEMHSSLPNVKLECNNFTSWKYKMYQYLVGKDFWGYIDGDFEKILNIIDISYLGWQNHVLLHTCIQDHILDYVGYVACKYSEESMGKSKEDILCQHNHSQVSTLRRVA